MNFHLVNFPIPPFSPLFAFCPPTLVYCWHKTEKQTAVGKMHQDSFQLAFGSLREAVDVIVRQLT